MQLILANSDQCPAAPSKRPAAKKRPRPAGSLAPAQAGLGLVADTAKPDGMDEELMWAARGGSGALPREDQGSAAVADTWARRPPDPAEGAGGGFRKGGTQGKGNDDTKQAGQPGASGPASSAGARADAAPASRYNDGPWPIAGDSAWFPDGLFVDAAPPCFVSPGRGLDP